MEKSLSLGCAPGAPLRLTYPEMLVHPVLRDLSGRVSVAGKLVSANVRYQVEIECLWDGPAETHALDSIFLYLVSAREKAAN